jgi:hypothetical protein
VHSDGRWAWLQDTIDNKPQAEALKLNIGVGDLSSYDPDKNACTSPARYEFMYAVYSISGFLLLCALVDLLLPRKRRFLSCLVPETAEDGAKGLDPEVKADHPAAAAAIAQAIPVVFIATKFVLMVVDVISDIYGAYLVRDAKKYMWGFIVMLLAPNVIAALVIHLRLAFLAKEQLKGGHGGSILMPHQHMIFPVYQWLSCNGGFCMLLLSSIVLVPFWLLSEIPILFGAVVGHLSKRSLRDWTWLTTGPWLHVGHLCSLMSLVTACTESPFSAVVFTYNYERGMTYRFPTLLNDKQFLFTVGTSLLHIVMEVWRMVPCIKEGKVKERMRELFLNLIVTTDAHNAEQKVSASTAAAGGTIGKGDSSSGTILYYPEHTIVTTGADGGPEFGVVSHTRVVVASSRDAQVVVPGAGAVCRLPSRRSPI